MERSELIEALKNNVVLVHFTKKSGEERLMKATLMAEHLPPSDAQVQVEPTEEADAIVVWDLDKLAWRSFRFDSIIDTRVAL